MNKLDQCVEYLEKCLEIKKKVFNNEKHPEIGRLLLQFGLTYNNMGDYDKALEQFEQAYDIFLNSFGEDHPHT